jgi:hypothetical protein
LQWSRLRLLLLSPQAGLDQSTVGSDHRSELQKAIVAEVIPIPNGRGRPHNGVRRPSQRALLNRAIRENGKVRGAAFVEPVRSTKLGYKAIPDYVAPATLKDSALESMVLNFDIVCNTRQYMIVSTIRNVNEIRNY